MITSERTLERRYNLIAVLLIGVAIVLGGGGSPAPYPELALQVWSALLLTAWVVLSPEPWPQAPRAAWQIAGLLLLLPAIQLVPAEGTYLLWLDCRELGMSDGELRNFFIREAKVGMNPGAVFGAGGGGFMRLNIGASRRVVAEAMQRIARAVQARA